MSAGLRRAVVALLMSTSAGLAWAQVDSLEADSQARRLPRPSRAAGGLILGLGAHLTSYQGDLTTQRALQSPGLGALLTLQFDSRRRVSPQLTVGFGGFQAGDLTLPPVSGRQANTFVSTRFWFATLSAVYRPLRRPLEWGEFWFQPFVSAGVGLLNFTPSDSRDESLVDQPLTRATGESYGTGTFTAPISLGGELRLGEGIGLALDYTWMLTGTEYLDNIGQLGRGTGSDALHRFCLSLRLPLSAGRQTR